MRVDGRSTAAALGSGFLGAIALTLLHESMKRRMSDPPRLDLVGESAIAKSMRMMGKRPPRGNDLRRAALTGEMITNSLFFALVGKGPGAWLRGLFLGTLAGVGAALVPTMIGLASRRPATTRAAKFLTCGYYVAGGLSAAATSRAISAARARHL